MPVRPTSPEPANGVHEIHPFLKSMHLADSLTTRFGFSVKAGMQAPNRPVGAGQVASGNVRDDFPANSFFNVCVVVDLPAGRRPVFRAKNLQAFGLSGRRRCAEFER